MSMNLKLEKISGYAPQGPVVCCILDGVGLAPAQPGNAVRAALMPNFTALCEQQTLSMRLRAHGTAVGMPSDDDMGNSEVGHNAMGAGRVFDQGAKLVDIAIKQGKIFESPAWKRIIQQATLGKHTLHFIGLLSDGNVHSHIEHLFAMLDRAAAEGVKTVRLHVLLDGRDVSDHSALDYVDLLEAKLAALNAAGVDYRIASGGGRMVTTMDRYNANWAIVERGWAAHVLGNADMQRASAREAIVALRDAHPGISDQNLPAFVVVDQSSKAVGPVADGDAVVMFNFRGDRAIEISRAFEDPNFNEFPRQVWPQVFFAGMLEYDGDLHIPKHYLVAPPAIDRPMGQYLAENKVRQLAISETQKFGHVTYFWNGNRSGQFDPEFEEYIEIPSDVRPFEQRPWMKCAEITDVIEEQLANGFQGQLRVNYANGDMVGHTGDYTATVTAMQAVDIQVGRLQRAVAAVNGIFVLTADHGNAEQMYDLKEGTARLDRQGAPVAKTSHTLNPVPFIVQGSGLPFECNPEVAQPGLANIAATLLNLMGYVAPDGYEPSLLKLTS